MNYIEFAKKPVRLYGAITVSGKSKIGQFRPVWNRWTNSLEYGYFTPNGRKGSGGFTLKRAYDLFLSGIITENPEHGKPENYC